MLLFGLKMATPMTYRGVKLLFLILECLQWVTDRDSSPKAVVTRPESPNPKETKGSKAGEAIGAVSRRKATNDSHTGGSSVFYSAGRGAHLS